MSILSELQTVIGEKITDPTKLVKRANAMSDEKWGQLSKETQDWVNGSVESIETTGKPLPLEGTVAEEKPAVDGQADGKVVEMKPKKEKKAKAPKAPKEPKAPKAPKVAKRRGVQLEPAAEAKACREGTKQAVLVDLLAQPKGATFEKLHAAMNGPDFKHLKPWKEVTTRSALHWDVHSVKGYGIRTEFEDDGTPVYHLVLPKGMDKPVPHTPRKSSGEKKASAA